MVTIAGELRFVQIAQQYTGDLPWMPYIPIGSFLTHRLHRLNRLHHHHLTKNC